MWSPAGEAYRRRRTVGFGLPIVAKTFPDLTVETAAQ